MRVLLSSSFVFLFACLSITRKRKDSPGRVCAPFSHVCYQCKAISCSEMSVLSTRKSTRRQKEDQSLFTTILDYITKPSWSFCGFIKKITGVPKYTN